MPRLEDEQETLDYKKFVSLVKTNLHDDFFKFNFLKDYYNSHNEGRDNALWNTYQTFKGIYNNLYRSNYHKYRRQLYTMTNKSSKLNLEYQLFYCNEYLKVLNISKRSLLKSSKEKTADELAEILDKINDLETYINELEKKKESSKSLLVYSKALMKKCRLALYFLESSKSSNSTN